MSKMEMRMVEICEGCGELIEHCLCDMEDVCGCDCDCCECNELSDEEEAILKYLSEKLQLILETNGCPDCIMSQLIDVYWDARGHGYDDCKDNIKEILG